MTLRYTCESRLASFEQYHSSETASEWSSMSTDILIDWWFAEARKIPDVCKAMNLEVVAFVVLSPKFAALHNIIVTCMDVAINMLSPESEQGLVQILRNEIGHVLKGHSGSWSPASLDQMHRLDSVVYETLSLDGVDGAVYMEGGITGEDGLGAPEGNKIRYYVVLLS